MTGQYGVEPTALTDLAGKFDLQAEDLADPIHAFAGTSAEVGEAFGALGACDGAMEKYQKLLAGTLEALSHLPEVFTGDAARLRINASNYQDADQVAIGHLQSAARVQWA
ncbi:type VII secretion target [Streptomyces sp. GS7]|uniref:type VII secretion target n=1 Tax=Streptomyces sp. GS7 TaxID=2692234 RepID=UPI001317F2E4|nr:type VII secretion target [Streptomyces sp. GS7]QHC26036.1 ESX-1 secretion-associated protein [Streptomyces sp. GS7]